MENPNPTLYQHLDEARREIRLIEVISAAPSQTKIELRLHVVSLLDKPLFCALSYLWGDASVREPVTLNGKTFQVTKNLARALRVVKYHYKKLHPFKRSSKFRIWADAVCINQDDLEERGTQVDMMGSLFRDADTVFGSLAPSEEFDDATISLSFSTIQLLYNELKDVKSETELYDLKWISKHEALRIKHGDAPFGNVNWGALWHFSHSELFRRVWIRQEICLAKSLIFVHGESAMSFSKLTTVLNAINIAKNRLLKIAAGGLFISAAEQITPAISPLLMSLKISTILELREYSSQIARQDPFSLRQKWAITLMGAETTASNPKDYIYGFLGLNDLGIKSDYTENTSLAQLYSQYIHKWLEERRVMSLPVASQVTNFSDLNQELWFLRYAGLGLSSQEFEVPSWAPAYHVLDPMKTYVLPMKYTHAELPILLAAENATVQDLDLLVSGVVLDEIASIQPNSIKDMMMDEHMINFCANYIGESRNLDRRQRSLESIFRATTTNSMVGSDPIFVSDILAWINILLGFDDSEHERRLALVGLEDPGRFTEWFLQNFSASQVEDVKSFGGHLPLLSGAQVDGIFRVLQLLNRQHRLLETKRGYLGHAPVCAKPGDIIAAFKDSPLPSVLRKVDDHYAHVGCCWIYEYVTGEIDKHVSEESMKLKRFVIS